MAEIIALEFEDGSGKYTLFVERRQADSVTSFSADGSDVIRKVTANVDAVFAGIHGVLDSLAKRFQESKLPPDKIEVKLGLKASAKTGFVVANADGSAEIEVKLEWTRHDAENASPSTPIV